MKKLLLTAIMLILWIHSFSQCSKYQVYESFGTTSVPTQGGTWTQNSVITVTSPVKTGLRSIGFNGSGDWIRTPQIASPGILSFWYRRSTNTTAWTCVIETSPNGTTWTSRGTITSITAAYQQYSLNLGSLGLTNVYVRLRDARVSGAHERYIDDLAWTSTSVLDNNLLPFLSNCSQTISGNTIITDHGSYSDSYNNNLSRTITFTPSDPSKKLLVSFSLVDIETDYDFIYVYDGANGAAPLLATLTGTLSPIEYIATNSAGELTIRFVTDVSNIGIWAGFEATLSMVTPLPVELIYFDGQPYPSFNILKWSTASEHNSDYFKIERSIDGIAWNNIGTSLASGNSNTVIHYTYLDTFNEYSIHYYRLVQVDYDGQSKTYDPILLDNTRSFKTVIKYINMLGQEVDAVTKGLLIKVYEDGSLEKIYN
jgi:hypothetical protein